MSLRNVLENLLSVLETNLHPPLPYVGMQLPVVVVMLRSTAQDVLIHVHLMGFNPRELYADLKRMNVIVRKFVTESLINVQLMLISQEKKDMFSDVVELSTSVESPLRN